MNWTELKRTFRDFEKDNKSGKHLTAEVIFTEESFNKPYSKESRTYRFSSDNKVFLPNMGGYSIFASCIDGTDQGVRIEQYMEEERGSQNEMPWKVEDCYIIEE